MTANLDISWLGEKQKTSMFIYGFQEYVSKNLLDRYFLGGAQNRHEKVSKSPMDGTNPVVEFSRTSWNLF